MGGILQIGLFEADDAALTYDNNIPITNWKPLNFTNYSGAATIEFTITIMNK